MKFKLLLIFTFALFSITFGQKANNLYDRGVEEYKAAEFPKSIRTFTEVIQISPYFIEAYVFRARAYHVLAKNDSALADFATALQKKSGYLPAHYFRAECFFDLKNYDAAIPDLDKVILEKPTYQAAYLLRAKCFQAKNEIDKAISDYTYLVNQGSNDSIVYYNRAKLYMQKNMPKAAIHDFEKVTEIAPRHANAWYYRATLLESRDKKEEAILNYTKVLDMDPNHEEARTQRARLLLETKKYDKALEDYSYIIDKLRTKNVGNLASRARCYAALAKYKEAEKDLARALEIDPGNDVVFVEKARMRMSRGDSTGSIPDLRKAIFFNPKNAEAPYLRGRILYQNKKFNEALTDLDNSIKLKPIAEAYFYRALVYFEMNNKEKFCQDLLKSDQMGFEEAQKLRKKACPQF